MYSYGIILWEIAMQELPWEDLFANCTQLEQFNALNKALKAGRRPPVPDGLDKEHPVFVDLMRRCWAGDPADRPKFSEVAVKLASVMSDIDV